MNTNSKEMKRIIDAFEKAEEKEREQKYNDRKKPE